MRSFGRFQIAAVDAGRYRLDGGAAFGAVPKCLWQRSIAADENNRVTFALRPLLVVDESGRKDRRILIDTGIGDRPGPQLGELHEVEPPAGGIRQAVRRAGVDPNEITDVILTHLHVDHAGGSTELGDDGELRPAFPEATYHLQRRAYKWAQHATERDRASFREADFAALATRGCLHLYDGPQELFDGLSVILSEGHTVGQQLPLIDGGEDGKLLFCGDVIPTRAHIQLAWMLGYDLYPLTTLEEKRLLLAQAVQEGWILFLEHDPVCAACTVAEQQGEVVGCEDLGI
jgi:glyoxylase-like metal-dependent hydrolase (beta-lactamase superfamily II)